MNAVYAAEICEPGPFNRFNRGQNMAHETNDPFGVRSAFAQIQRRTHSGLAIAVAAILDSQLELCLKQAMLPMPKKLYAQLFDPMRALGSFASKITMAYALGIVTRDIYNRLENVRKIRNAFAHSTVVLNFESAPVAPLLDRLKKSMELKTNSPQGQFLECVKPIDEALNAYLKSKGAQAL